MQHPNWGCLAAVWWAVESFHLPVFPPSSPFTADAGSGRLLWGYGCLMTILKAAFPRHESHLSFSSPPHDTSSRLPRFYAVPRLGKPCSCLVCHGVLLPACLPATVLRGLRIDLICLQETHLREGRRDFWSKSFFEMFIMRSQSKGVMLGISKALFCMLVSRSIDKEAWYIILRCCLNWINVIIVGIYTPNTGQPEFWDKIYSDLGDTSGYESIMLGDFYTIFDTKLDRSSKASTVGLPKNFL